MRQKDFTVELKRISDFITSAIAIVSPSWALNRAVKKSAFEQFRKYDAARVKKSDRYWIPENTDADSEIISDLGKLRSRSSDLVRNNPWATAIVDGFVSNVVGSGIRPQAEERTEKALLEAFEIIDETQETDFYGLEQLAFRQMLERGESFLKINQREKDNSISLQILEPDQIWSNRTENNGNEVRAGVEIDRFSGRKIAYYVNYHPGAYGYSSSVMQEKRVPSEDMIHLYMRLRPGQTRGVPILAPVISHLHDLGEYLEAELISARVAACLAVMVKKNYQGTPEVDSDNEKIQNLTPGMIGYLRPGEDISIVKPERPGGQFDKFTALLLRSIASGVGISYETISKDFSTATYSSARMGLIQERAKFKWFQKYIERALCDRVAREVILTKYLGSHLPEKSRKEKIVWLSPGFEWVDPIDEVNGQILAINNNLKTKKEVVAERGGDLDEVLKQRAKEKEQEKELGIENGNGTKQVGEPTVPSKSDDNAKDAKRK